MINKQQAATLWAFDYNLVDKGGEIYVIESLGNNDCFEAHNSHGLYTLPWRNVGKDYHILAFDNSDLTKEITVKEETFVPLFEVCKIRNCYLYRGEYIQWDSNDYGITPTYSINNINEWPNEIIEKITELHFAVNLPEGSWIPVTENNNPYK